jgi:phytoene synthase
MNNNLLEKHAKSFYWASFFLSREIFQKCSALYNFCRTLDDIADEINQTQVKKNNFSKFKSDFLNKNFDNLIIKEMWSIISSENISKKVVVDLFDGVETDLEEKVQINSKKDLFVYSYRVAGTVGLMMSKILKVKNKEALKGAVDLGIAMQLTNISREVNEDKKLNRKYIDSNFS